MKIPLYFEKLSMYDRQEEPCMVALPFAEGELKQASSVTMMDGDVPIPTQCEVTSLWPDGSVKWLLTHFLADLPANQGKSFEAFVGRSTVLPQQPATVSLDGSSCLIDTGAVRCELNGPGETGVFRSIRSSDGLMLNDVSGPTIQDRDNVAYACEIGSEGWEIVENGPIRVVVQAKGKHLETIAKDKCWFDYVVRVYAYAGKPWLRLDYQIINREAEDEQMINGLEIVLGEPLHEATAAGVETALGKSNYATTIKRGAALDKLSHKITVEELKYQGNEQTAETMYGTFFGDWYHPEVGGFSVTMFQAQQNFPKQLDVSSEGVTAGIIPQGTGLVMIQGMAKTHRLYIHLRSSNEDLESVNNRSLQFQLPDRPVLGVEAYERAGVIEPLDVSYKQRKIERTLVYLADYRVSAYGILHFGDAPDRAYSDQGRGLGEWVWTNNEYDLPHSMMHMYARKGERRFLDYLLVAAEHWMDVDICHHSDNPLRYQGQIPHSARHVTDNPAVCHEWVEGLLDYYHITGERRALEAAMGVGENVLRILQTPRFQEPGGYHARESGWALRSLGALYVETGQDKWLVPADRIVDQLEAWMDKFGTWMSPYTDHTVVRVPFMISVAANSLMRYYRIRPQERIKKMVVQAMEDMLEHCYMKDEEMFYYKELPSLVRLGTANPIVLEALSYAYEFTEEDKFLQAGKESFRILCRRIEREIVAVGSKEISGDALILWQGLGPKFFAQYYYPLFFYYRTASRAGIEL